MKKNKYLLSTVKNLLDVRVLIRIITFHGDGGGPLLGPSMNGLVTDGNTKLCCQGFV